MRLTRPLLSWLGFVVTIASSGALAPAQSLYFADVLNPGDPDGNSIRQVNTDGSGLHTVIPTGGGVRGLDVDTAGDYIYWTDVDNFAIRRAHLNGSGQQDLVNTGLQFPSAIRLDLAAGKMYWGDQLAESIMRANLDGSGVETPLGGTVFFRGLALDPAHSRMFWTVSDTASTGRILTADMNGSGTQPVVAGGGQFFKPGNIAVDVAGGKVYWTDAVSRMIRRANLDGSNIEPLYDASFIGSPKGIALDVAGGKVYWGQEFNDPDSGGFLYGEIHVMDLDGMNPQLVVSLLGSVNDIVFVPGANCPPDYNHSGNLTVQDIFDFLAGWFAGDAAADFNHQDGITVQDIFDFLGAWFAGC